MIRFLVCIFVTVSSFLLIAQEPAKESARVEFRVTRFDPGDQSPPKFKVGTGGGQVELTVPLTFIDGPHKASLREDRYLDFWRGDGEKPEFSVAIEANEHKDLLLIFFPVGKSFKVIKVLTPVTQLRGTDRYLVNASKDQIAVKIGNGQQVVIDSGKSGILKGPGGNDVVSLPVLISQRQGEEWKPASTENWYFDPRSRAYLFAYTSERTGHLTFHVITERL
jgi:hypothetical protein